MKKISTHWVWVIIFISSLFIGCFIFAQPSLESSAKTKTENIKLATTAQLQKDLKVPAAETLKDISGDSAFSGAK